MEDVVLHYQPGSADGLGSLLERTEKLLEVFPCRTPPVFTPWFPPASAGRRLPIRPAKPAPVITSAQKATADCLAAEKHSVCAGPEGTFCISETPKHLQPRESGAASPGKPQAGGEGSQLRRSWSVFTQRGALLQRSQPPSKRFDHMVSVHKLHPRQRAKWVISELHCRDVEKVWRSLSRTVGRSRLPTCNANIQRERAEIWVFCDLLYAEQVGRFLKAELRLAGRISLSVHRLGDIFSL
ncbi:shieldin complex subunit 3 [Leuresthes tenuis]|uniref:shieldin complex subunit 3 n=1 Tax=Leuresthes tenuis TaxID=355514 RepID=UPI003B50F86B